MKCQECNGRGHFLFAMSTPTCDVCGGTGVVGAKPLFVPEPHWLMKSPRVFLSGFDGGKWSCAAKPASFKYGSGMYYNTEAIRFQDAISAIAVFSYTVISDDDYCSYSMHYDVPKRIGEGQDFTFAPGAIQIPESDV